MPNYSSHSLKKPSKSRCGDASFAGEIFIQDEKYILLMVADGVSSRPKDWLASRTTIEVVKNHLEQSDSPVQDAFVKAVKTANEYILSGAEGTIGMLSTLAAVLYSEAQQKLWIINVGDSRVYGFKKGKFYQLTRDDSKSQIVKVNGKISYNDGLPLMKNYLTKAIGQADLNVEVQEINAGNFDALILASDGFYSISSFEDDVSQIIHQADMKKSATQMQEQWLTEIRDDASFAILRLTVSESFNLKEVIEKGKSSFSDALILGVLDKELILAVETKDLKYQESILNFMESERIFYEKQKMIEILDSMILNQSPFVQKMGLMIRKL